MKTLKYFAAALVCGALAFSACSTNPGPEGGNEGGDIVVGGETEEAPDLDPVDGQVILAVYFEVAPCNDVVLAGQYTWNNGADVAAWDGNYAKFAAVNGSSHWYAVQIDRPAEGELAYGKGVQLDADGSFSWDYQWARNSITVIDGIFEELKDENEGEQQFVFNSESEVVYASASSWANNPCVDFPVAETAWIKHPWAGGEEWTWAEMTKTAEGTFTYEGIFGGNGANIALEEDGAAAWYELGAIEGSDAVVTGDNVVFTFVSTSGTRGTLSVAKK